MNQPKSSNENQASSPEPGIRQEADNSIFGGGQQAAIGNDNIQIQGDNNWLGNTLNFFFGQQTTPVGNPARPKNERILLAAVKEEVTARLRQSLHNAVLINLGKESQPQQVKRRWDAEIKIGLKPAVSLSDTTTILEVFDSPEIAGKLLILGAPGAGKTTTQLELAQALVSRAEEQPDYPVPVLFNLSSWKDDRQSITNWLVTELKSKYGVSNKLGKEWVNNHQLLPLLDGLDELEPQRQELCVQKINQFLAGENRPLYLVVCSRSEEYSNYATQLQLNGAIYLQPLTKNQISDYLNSINYIGLWSTISSDLDLLELVKTPLLLSITVLASQEISVEEWHHLTSTAERIQYLLDAYIWRMLTRHINSRTYFKTKPPNVKQTRMWLVWLAKQLQREAKTEFLIEEMQPYWLVGKLKKQSYQLIYQLFYQVIYGMAFGLIFGLMFLIGVLFNVFSNIFYNGLISLIAIPLISLMMVLIIMAIGGLSGLLIWIPFGVIRWLFGGRKKWEITLSEKIIFFEINRQKIFKALIELFICGLIGRLINETNGLIFGLIFGLGGGLISNLISVKPEIDIETRKRANQGIWKSASIGLIFGLIQGLIIGLTFGLIGILINGLSGLIIGLTFGLLVGLLSGLFSSGGKTCIQHLCLRLILYFNGYIPWNYARFLDYCTERLFLQRVGGRYRFIHRLLQDHFAKMEFKRN
ncbi:NACHT domain-containing protein [Nostoc sp. C110]|uniref:NACHT domain-containing protein n=1 Tax=Nostoc sp. C110 TaxID=3349876 RepID=UPI00370D2D3C